MAALAAALLAIGAAHAQPAAAPAAKRKPLPRDLPTEVVPMFVDAVLADQDGKLDTAVNRYRDAIRVAEHAALHYNVADLHRRMEKWAYAIESYRKYVELAPAAADRAEVERLIAQLAARPRTIVIDGEDLDAVVLVDGKLIGPSPVVIQLADGQHVFDRVSPTGFAHRPFEVREGHIQHVTITTRPGEPGNVILSANASGSWSDGGHEYQLNSRFTLKPGRHQTYFVSPDRACSRLVFDVPRSDELTYVFIEVGPVTRPPTGRGCVPIQVRQTKLRFAR